MADDVVKQKVIKRPASSDPAAKRYSRRHDTDERHLAARHAFAQTRSAEAKWAAALTRQDARDARTTDEQITLLARRPGKSARELRRLTGR